MLICVDNCAVCTPKETYYWWNLRDVPMMANVNYFTNLYCASLWWSYKGPTFSRVKVAYTNIFMFLLSAETMQVYNAYVNFNVDCFQTVLRRSIYSFKQRPFMSSHSVICNNVNQWCLFLAVSYVDSGQNCYILVVVFTVYIGSIFVLAYMYFICIWSVTEMNNYYYLVLKPSFGI